MKTEMLIKAECRLVLGIDDEGEDRRLGAYGARDGIDDQRGPEPLSSKLLIDREPADKARRENGITGQSPGLLREQFAERQACRGEGVIAGDLARLIERHEAIAHPAPNVLGCQFPQIAVERRCPAAKRRAVVRRAEPLDREAFSQCLP